MLDVARIKADFPIMEREVHGKRLVYLDSASSSQKPNTVLDAMDRYYRNSHANVHRGVYTIADEATTAFEAARARVARFLGAGAPEQIVFVRNATEAINLVAYSWARANLREGDSIVVTEMEHHANVVPWHILAAERGVELRWVRLTPDYARSRTRPTRPARRSSSTPASRRPSFPPTCRLGTPISWRCRRTRWSARPVSARCGRVPSCSKRCRRSSVVAR